MKKGLTIFAHYNGYTSYGLIGVNYTLALADAGVNVFAHPVAIDKSFGSSFNEDVSNYFTMKDTGTQWELLFHPPNYNPPDYWPSRKKRIIYTMWETDKLPDNCVESLNKFHSIIVPTEWVRQTFKKSGVTRPIYKVPLGVDTDKLSADFSAPPKQCVFGIAGRLAHGGVRKGLNWLMDVFKKAFPVEEDVFLKVKGFPDCPLTKSFDSRIQVLQAYLSDEEMAKWYRDLTAYINPSCSEGFGLHDLEAMSCGKPVIRTMYSGTTDFFDNSSGFVVKHNVVPVDDPLIYQNCGNWGKPDEASMIAMLRYVYAHPGFAFLKGAHAHEVAKRYSFKNSVDKLITTLRIIGAL